MAQRILLPNDCSMSTPSVNPKNWKTGGATIIKQDWYIQYYFYPHKGESGKLVILKGMNHLKTLSKRRSITKGLISYEIENCKKGYNPITKICTRELDSDTELHPYLHFITALRIVSTRVQSTEKHKKEVSCCINSIEKKVSKLKMGDVTINQLSRRQLKQLLESFN